jgi:hypothetical protein
VHPTSKSDPKSKLKIFRGGRPAVGLRQAGVAPAADMPAGHYKVTCEAARITQKWGKSICEFSFRIVEGQFFGTTLPGWIPIFLIGDCVHPGKYTRACAVALGRESDPGDDLDPEAVFVGKVFLADVRFRATDGKKGRTPVDPTKRKDQHDFLRVHQLLALETL